MAMLPIRFERRCPRAAEALAGEHAPPLPGGGGRVLDRPLSTPVRSLDEQTQLLARMTALVAPDGTCQKLGTDVGMCTAP